MNVLIVGTGDKTETILEHLPSTFLLIDDGPIIDALELPKRRKITRLDLFKHSLNPLKGMNHIRAAEFVETINGIFPEGQNTLTKRYSDFYIKDALLSKPKRPRRGKHKKSPLELLISPTKETMDAYLKIQTLFFSPVLKNFLSKPTNLSLRGIVIARLDRSVLGDFDCFVVANILISAYRGQVVIPDFGFYGCAFHTKLIRQNRLLAGVHYLDEPRDLRQNLLLIEKKIGLRATADDAEVLAGYSKHRRGSEGHTTAIERNMGV